MWPTNTLLKSLGLEQHQGYSLLDALREEEEELGLCDDDPPIIVQKIAKEERVAVRKLSNPPLSPAPSWNTGLSDDPSSPRRASGSSGRSFIRKNAWPIRPRRSAETREGAFERIYSARWLRYVTQLARDILANVPVILTMVLLTSWTFVTSSVASYRKVSFWVPPTGIFIALVELAIRRYVQVCICSGLLWIINI